MEILIFLLLASLAYMSVVVRDTYTALPVRELTRRARDGDVVAEALRSLYAFGHSVRVVTACIEIALVSLFIWYSVRNFDGLMAFMVVLAVFIFLGLKRSRVDIDGLTARFAAKLAPLFGWLLRHIGPALDRLYNGFRKLLPVSIHTGIYTKDDLLRLLGKQKHAVGSQIPLSDLTVAEHALSFGDETVGSIMTPRRMVKVVPDTETIGPLLMDELHKSGHTRFPVWSVESEQVIGILYLHDLTNVTHGGLVTNTMRAKDVNYIHEEQHLREALAAFLRTRQQLFIVVNSFEEYVGVLSLEDVLEQVIGKQIVDEFDQYDDIRAVAARQAAKEHHTHNS